MPKPQKGKPQSANRQSIKRIASLLIIVILVLFGWLWWSKVYENPSNVFWGMISNSLETSSLTKQITETASDESLKETIELSLGQSNTAHAFSTLQQTGTTVKTEEINTPTSDYVRYTSINTDELSSAGKGLNFKPILNVWGSNVSNQSQNGSQLFSQTALGIIPIGNISAAERPELVKLAKATYSLNLADVKHQTVAGRLQYVYEVNVKPVDYVGLLKVFSKDMGLSGLDSVNPQSYASQPSVTFIVGVDVLSRNLVGVIYPNNSQEETYNGFGISQPPLTLPQKTISLSALQSRLSSIK